MIEVRELRKVYGELVAVDGVSLRVEPGTIFGLLGPNGAGKSTTLGCLSGLLTPTGGRAWILGHDVLLEPLAARRELGLVPQELALYEDLSARANLEFWGAAYGLGGAELLRRVREVLEAIGLADRADERVGRMSGGMKRRLNFGCGVVHKPRALLLDEPTVGVDPQSRVRLLELVREQARAGTSVLYTTHYMEEAQELCDHIAILDHGRILAQGSLEELRELVGGRDLVRLTGEFDPETVPRALAALPGVEVVTADREGLRLAVEGATRRLPELFGALERTGARVEETTMTQPSLESLFIALTGRELRE